MLECLAWWCLRALSSVGGLSVVWHTACLLRPAAGRDVVLGQKSVVGMLAANYVCFQQIDRSGAGCVCVDAS